MRSLGLRVGNVTGELPERERRALTLRERDGAGYAAIADALGVAAGEVAGLLVSARLEVRESVRTRPLPGPASPQCPRGRELLAMQQDGELDGDGDRAWLREHLQGCESCRAVRVALREADLACRAWVALPVAAGAPARVAAVAAAPVAAPARAPATAPRPRRAPAPAAAAARRPRRVRPVAVLTAALLLAAVAVAAAAIGGGLGGTDAVTPAAATPAPTAAPTTAPAARTPQPAVKRKRRARKRVAAKATPTATAVATPAATVAAPTAKKPKGRKTPAAVRKQTPRTGGGTTGELGDDTGGGLPAPTPAGEGGDVVPPPGDTFCDADRPNCDSG